MAALVFVVLFLHLASLAEGGAIHRHSATYSLLPNSPVQPRTFRNPPSINTRKLRGLSTPLISTNVEPTVAGLKKLSLAGKPRFKIRPATHRKSSESEDNDVLRNETLVLDVSCFEPFAIPGGAARCPKACPYLRFDPDRMCHFKCITKDWCLNAPNMPTSFADAEAGRCVVCGIPGCLKCVSPDQCAPGECQKGFEMVDGVCKAKTRNVWTIVWIVLALIIIAALTLVWALYRREARNTMLLLLAYRFRSMSKLRKDEASHPFFSLSTRLYNEVVSGVGALLHFRFQCFWWCWTVSCLVALFATSRYHGRLRITDALHMSPTHEHFIQHCEDFGTKDAEHLHAIHDAYTRMTGVIYVVTFIACILFAIRQKRTFKEEEDKLSSMEDYALLVRDMPIEIARDELEDDYLEYFRGCWGDDVLGVSICWDYIDCETKVLDEAVAMMHDHDRFFDDFILTEEQRELYDAEKENRLEELSKRKQNSRWVDPEIPWIDDLILFRSPPEDTHSANIPMSVASTPFSDVGSNPSMNAGRDCSSTSMTTIMAERPSTIVEGSEHSKSVNPTPRSDYTSPTPRSAGAPTPRSEPGTPKRNVTISEPGTPKPNVTMATPTAVKRSVMGSTATIPMQTSSSAKHRAAQRGSHVIQETVRKLKTTGYVFVIINTQAERDRIVQLETEGPLEKRIQPYTKSVASDCAQKRPRVTTDLLEPATVLWTGFSVPRQDVIKNIFRGIGSILLIIVVWAVCFYGPYAIYLCSWMSVVGKSEGNATTGTLLGLMTLPGNFLVYQMCQLIAEKAGFRSKDSSQYFNVCLYTFAIFTNTVVDLLLLFVVAHGYVQDSGVDATAVIRNPSMQYSLFIQMSGYLFPNTLLTPYAFEPIASNVLPYYMSKWVIRSSLRVTRYEAEQALGCCTFDLLRYGDILINVCLVICCFFLASSSLWWIFMWLLASLTLIYYWDHYRFLRQTRQTFFAADFMDNAAHYLAIFPCALLVVVYMFKYHGGDELIESWKVTKDDMTSEGPSFRGYWLYAFYHISNNVWCSTIVAFWGHVLIHYLLLAFVVPMFVPHKTPYEGCEDYASCARRCACNWFNSNPVTCLRSKYIKQHDPPFVYYVKGKEYVHEINEEILQYYDCPEFEAVDADDLQELQDHAKEAFKNAILIPAHSSSAREIAHAQELVNRTIRKEESAPAVSEQERSKTELLKKASARGRLGHALSKRGLKCDESDSLEHH